MVLLQQAVAYIFRKKTRNFILFLILFLILSCLYFCFSLMQVGGGMEAQIRKSGGASFSLVSKATTTFLDQISIEISVKSVKSAKLFSV